MTQNKNQPRISDALTMLIIVTLVLLTLTSYLLAPLYWQEGNQTLAILAPATMTALSFTAMKLIQWHYYD